MTEFPVLGGFTKLDFTPGGGGTRGMVASMSDMANSRYMATPGSSHYQVQELANKGFEDAATGLGYNLQIEDLEFALCSNISPLPAFFGYSIGSTL